MSLVKVLVIDDEASFMETLKIRLGKRGLTVIPARNGAEGLNKLAEDSSIDIVILDVKMTGMDGIQTLKHIKIDHPLTEVIMLAEPDTVEAAIEAMRLGAYDYHMKPCDIDMLVGQIAEAEAKRARHEQKIHAARMKEIAIKGSS
ncbi:MAG: response regulator [Thermodesulfobacteriota bacterium]